MERFLPYIDNWATCDQLSPQGIPKAPGRGCCRAIEAWLSSDHCLYHPLWDRNADASSFWMKISGRNTPRGVAQIRSEEYYVNMMIAWYFATALAKQYDRGGSFPGEQTAGCVDAQQGQSRRPVESYRITPEQKAYLKTPEGEGGTVNSPVQAAAAKNIRKRLDYLGRIWYNRYCSEPCRAAAAAGCGEGRQSRRSPAKQKGEEEICN